MDIQQNAGLTLCLSKAALAAGTTTTLSNTGTVVYAIDGKAYSAAALSNTATPTTDLNTGVTFVGIPVNMGSSFFVGYNAAGTLQVIQGSVEALDVAGNFVNGPKEPACPANFVPIGYIIVKIGSTGSGLWTFGASNLSGVTGATYIFQDLIALPGRIAYK